jgi:hypothetical protein
MNDRRLPLAILSLVAFGVIEAGQLTAQERFSIASDRVAIYNLVGEIRVERGSGSNVVVEVTRGGRDSDALRIDRRDRGGWGALVVRYPENTIVYRGVGRFSRSEFSIDDDGLFGAKNLDPALGAERATADASGGHDGKRVRVRGSGSGMQAHADLRILIPAGKAVAVHLGVGKVSIADVAADLQIDTRSGSASTIRTTGFLRIDTGSGAVTVTDASGDVAVNTGSGSVDAARVGKGLLKIHTGSGSVDLSRVAATEASITTGSGGVEALDLSAPNLKIHTGSGGISARTVTASRFDLHTGSGSINLNLTNDVEVGRVRTGSGGVTISTTRGLGAEVTLDTGSGGIDVGIPLDVYERRRSFLRGRIGDGNGTLDVGTGSGGITLR